MVKSVESKLDNLRRYYSESSQYKYQAIITGVSGVEFFHAYMARESDCISIDWKVPNIVLGQGLEVQKSDTGPQLVYKKIDHIGLLYVQTALRDRYLGRTAHWSKTGRLRLFEFDHSEYEPELGCQVIYAGQELPVKIKTMPEVTSFVLNNVGTTFDTVLDFTDKKFFPLSGATKVGPNLNSGAIRVLPTIPRSLDND